MSAYEIVKDIRLVIQTILLLAFYVMTGFYLYQKKKKRARWEVLYIATVAGVANTIGLAAGHLEPLRRGFLRVLLSFLLPPPPSQPPPPPHLHLKF